MLTVSLCRVQHTEFNIPNSTYRRPSLCDGIDYLTQQSTVVYTQGIRDPVLLLVLYMKCDSFDAVSGDGGLPSGRMSVELDIEPSFHFLAVRFHN